MRILDSKTEIIRIESLNLWGLKRIYLHSFIGDPYYFAGISAEFQVRASRNQKKQESLESAAR
jgi:hypothetical protein